MSQAQGQVAMGRLRGIGIWPRGEVSDHTMLVRGQAVDSRVACISEEAEAGREGKHHLEQNDSQ